MDGYVTGFGNPDWARTHPAAVMTAPSVSAVLEAGAACIGKTVMDEMAYRLDCRTQFTFSNHLASRTKSCCMRCL